MQTTSPVYVIGDIHGQFEQLSDLLLCSGLVGMALAWIGGDATLWFVGDLVDRGPASVAVMDLVMRLQGQAAAVGGRVSVLLGNHEVLLLAAQRFGRRATTRLGWTFKDEWEQNGGYPTDLARLTPQHTAWLTRLPAMARAGERLLLHADSTFYTHYGRSITMVNQAITKVLLCDDMSAWAQLLEKFYERRAFVATRIGGVAAAAQLLKTFGGQQIIHGHTPISSMYPRAPRDVTGPLIYSGGLCVNVDGGMYLGGYGFVYELPSLDVTHAQQVTR